MKSAEFDEEDHNTLNDEGCLSVVHFLWDPKQVGGETLLIADLGSAPIMALDQLLVTLGGYQPGRIEIGAA